MLISYCSRKVIFTHFIQYILMMLKTKNIYFCNQISFIESQLKLIPLISKFQHYSALSFESFFPSKLLWFRNFKNIQPFLLKVFCSKLLWFQNFSIIQPFLLKVFPFKIVLISNFQHYSTISFKSSFQKCY
jgi:hypothetical protein